MIQEIKKLIFQTFSSQDCMGVFFSVFDNKGVLIRSNGVLETDKTLDILLDLLYNGMIKPIETNVSWIVFDFVKNLTVQSDINTFLKMSPKETGVVLTSTQDGKSGVLLPETKGIENMQQALACIKQKYQLAWNGIITTFTTTKITFQK